MSSQEFVLEADPVNNESLETALKHLSEYNENGSDCSLDSLRNNIEKATGKTIDLEDFGAAWSFYKSNQNNKTNVMIDAGPSVQYDFYEAIINLFLSCGVKNLKARYFDSSTGSKVAWKYKDGKLEEDEIEIEDKHIVFTGKMVEGTREEMEELAKSEGAIVQKAVNGKTNILVIGENVGQKKLEKAKALNVQIITEEEFMDIIEYGAGV